ncbi:MAG: hypothetical protein NT014_06390 [Candidatus Omnitrophica bacterium]|nr:hypothetical protein [Candidatus Omnitrophota bacterium]
MDTVKKLVTEKGRATILKDILVLAIVTIIFLVFSYFFNVFIFLVELFQKNPKAITYIDEIITLLVVLSIGLAVFSWRRLLELKKETAQRIKFQEELLLLANTRAETERIISKQLHCEIELHKLEGKKKLAK